MDIFTDPVERVEIAQATRIEAGINQAGAPLFAFGGGPGGAKSSTDPATGQELLDYIAQIDKIFWETKAAS